MNTDKSVVLFPEKITVRGGDYTYQGYIVSIFFKRSGQVRYVVEDDNGRLFIHNNQQIVGLEKSDDPTKHCGRRGGSCQCTSVAECLLEVK